MEASWITWIYHRHHLILHLISTYQQHLVGLELYKVEATTQHTVTLLRVCFFGLILRVYLIIKKKREREKDWRGGEAKGSEEQNWLNPKSAGLIHVHNCIFQESLRKNGQNQRWTGWTNLIYLFIYFLILMKLKVIECWLWTST